MLPERPVGRWSRESAGGSKKERYREWKIGFMKNILR